MVHHTVSSLQLAKRGMEYSQEIAAKVLEDKLPVLKDIAAVTIGKLQAGLENIIPTQMSVGDIVGLAKVLSSLDVITNLAENKPTQIIGKEAVTKEKIIEVYQSMSQDPVTNPNADIGEVVEVVPEDDEF